jgi:pimeloyl-ACP methyl ester carboxylesterase
LTVALVHGVPESAAIWDPLRAELGRDDVVALSPPGFGAPVPDGFAATADDYLQWLIAEVEALDGPVDLVGHDWGGAHVVRLVAARPDLVRSWCTDVAGLHDPEYVWHELARGWQQPGRGEAAIEAMVGMSVDERAAAYVQVGMTPAAALAASRACDAQMGRCILALYRSALQPRLAEWGHQVEGIDRPALVINTTADPWIDAELTHRAAVRFGAQEAVLDGLGHWWLVHDPARGAAAIRDFLKKLD